MNPQPIAIAYGSKPLRVLATADAEGHVYYDPDQPRVPAGATDGGQWTGTGVGQHFSDAPLGKKGAAVWRKKMQKLYDTDAEFRAATDASMLFTQGEYNVVRALGVQEITGKLPDRYKDSSLTKWGPDEVKMSGNPLSGYKKYFEGQPFIESGSDESRASWRDGVRALNDAVRTGPLLDVTLYRGVYGRKNMEALLGMKPGQTFDLVGPTSFTAERNIALQFAMGTNRGQRGGGLARGVKSAVIEVLPGARGIPVAALSPWNQSEVISGGRFRIKEIRAEIVSQQRGGWTIESPSPHIVVEQVSTFRNR